MSTSNKKPLDKNTLKIILYLISQLDGILGKTHLQKLLFLTDLISVRRFKMKMTQIDYKKYYYGPYSPQLNQYTDELIKKGLIDEKQFPFISDKSKKFSRYYIKRRIPLKENLMGSLGPEKVMVLDEVVNSFGNLSLQNVLDVVYKLQFVKDSELDKPLIMAKEVEEDPEEEPEIFN